MKRIILLSLMLLFTAGIGKLSAQQTVRIPSESEKLLYRQWQMMKMTDPENTLLKEQKEGERDLFTFRADHSLTISKNGKVANGFWKYSPESSSMVITDETRHDNVAYTILVLTDKELVLLYPDEMHGSKKLFFSQVP